MGINEAFEIVNSLRLYPANWIINKGTYKGHLKFIETIEANEAIEIILKDYIKKIKLINEMAEFLIGFPVFNYNGEIETTLTDKEDVIKYFEERCKNAKD